LDYAQRPADMEPAARLQEALDRAARRYEATPPGERGFAQKEVPINLFRVYAAFASMSSIAQDLEMLERLPRLDPLAGQTPLVDWLIAYRAGRTTTARTLTAALAERLAGVTNDDSGPVFIARALRQAMLYTL